MFLQLMLVILNTLPEKTEDKNDDDDATIPDDDDDNNFETKDCESDLLYLAKKGTRYKLRKIPKIIRYVRYSMKKGRENHFRERLMLFMP